MPPDPPVRIPSLRASRRVVRNASRSETDDQAVDGRAVEVRGPEVLADALDQVRMDVVLAAGVDRALGVGADHHYVGLLLAQVASRFPRRCRLCRRPSTRWVIRPSVCAQISGPVDSVVGLRVGGIDVLVRLKSSGDLRGQPVGNAVIGLRRVWRDVGRARSPPPRHRRAAGRSSPGTSCRASPRPRCSPSDRAAIARPVPVLPEVGSTIVPPGLSLPSRSAASISATATRSLIEPPGIEVLDLRDQLRRQSGPDPREAHQRRVTDRVENRILDGGCPVGHSHDSNHTPRSPKSTGAVGKALRAPGRPVTTGSGGRPRASPRGGRSPRGRRPRCRG